MLQDQVTLPAQLDSVPAGRHFLQRMLGEWGLTEVVDVAALLCSELLTNAVLHTRTAVSLVLRVDDDLVVEVTDQDTTPVLTPITAAGLDSLLREPDLEAENGRGLMMVTVLARRWGIRPERAGKTVWFALELPGA